VFFFFPFFGFFGFFGTILIVYFVAKLGMRIFRDLFDDDYLSSDWKRSIGGSPFIRSFKRPKFRIKNTDDAEHQIFRLANKLKGRITISDIVINTGLGIKEAEEVMNKLVDGMRVRMEVDDRGIVVYEFPEIIARYEEEGR